MEASGLVKGDLQAAQISPVRTGFSGMVIAVPAVVVSGDGWYKHGCRCIPRCIDAKGSGERSTELVNHVQRWITKQLSAPKRKLEFNPTVPKSQESSLYWSKHMEL
jgi:hypothetical protein